MICNDRSFKQHVANRAVNKASMHVDMSLRSFTCRDKLFMKRLFITYIRPTLEYAVPVWCPLDVASATRLELVQRRYTKYITGLYNLSYNERLARLELQSLKLRREFLTVRLVNKILHNYINVSPDSVGLNLSVNNTRSRGVKLHVPRPLFTLYKSSFMYRAAIL